MPRKVSLRAAARHSGGPELVAVCVTVVVVVELLEPEPELEPVAAAGWVPALDEAALPQALSTKAAPRRSAPSAKRGRREEITEDMK
jgi:hypothetical protein